MRSKVRIRSWWLSQRRESALRKVRRTLSRLASGWAGAATPSEGGSTARGSDGMDAGLSLHGRNDEAGSVSGPANRLRAAGSDLARTQGSNPDEGGRSRGFIPPRSGRRVRMRIA